MNFSTLVIAFLLDYQDSLFGLEKTALVVLGAVLAVVELVHHLVVLLGKVRFGSPAKEKMRLVIIQEHKSLR